MKVAVSAQAPSLGAAVDPRFGRAAYFVLVETDDMTFEALENSSRNLGGGAGIQAARWMAEKGAKAVLTGFCGPNAHETLTAAGIQVMGDCSGTVAEAVEQYRSGALGAISAPNAGSHAGMPGGRP
jgi:predicted Fe-Mo cluster-binding NifX family protein